MTKNRKEWPRLDGMSDDQTREHIVALRSEVTNLRRQLSRYRSIVAGMRGSVDAIQALLLVESAIDGA